MKNMKLSVLFAALVCTGTVNATVNWTDLNQPLYIVDLWYDTNSNTFGKVTHTVGGGDAGTTYYTFTPFTPNFGSSGGVDQTYVDEKNAAQDTIIATKADKTYVDTELAKKASITYVDAQNAAQDATIATKADKTYVDTELGKKADKTYVDSENAAQDATIATKADKTYVDAQNAAQDATIAKGLNFAADTGSFNRQLGDVVTIQGDKNISTVAKDGVLSLAMSDDPVFDGVMTIGKGIKVAPTATIDMGGNVISNVGKGAISIASKDAVTGEQVFNLASDVAKNFGAGVAVTNDGRLTAPSIKITDAKTGKTTTHKNMGSAFDHVNANQVIHTARLDGLDVKTDNTAKSIAGIIGGGSVALSDGSLTTPTYSITDYAKGTSVQHKNIGDALGHLNKNQNALAKDVQALTGAMGNLRSDINRVRREAHAGTAAAMAIANLGQPYKPAQTAFGLSSAIYKGRVGVAAGVSRITENGKFLFKGAVNTNNDGQFGAAVSATYYFD